MKIIRLQSENIKRIKAVEIVPDPEGGLVIISGKNAQGKSSILDSMWYALGGTKAIPEKPIRKGQKSAKVELDLGEYMVERNWTADEKSYLKVTGKDGAVFPSPQTLLDRLIGDLTFDPLEFARMDQKGQREALLSLFKSLKDQLECMDEEKKKIYEERTFIGREAKKVQGYLESMTLPQNGLPEKEINLNDLVRKLNEAQEKNHQMESILQKVAENERQAKDFDYTIKESQNRIERLRLEIREEESKITRLNDQLRDINAKISEQREKLKGIQRIDTSAIEKEINQAEGTNLEIRQAREYQEKKKELFQIERSYAEMTDRIDDIEKKKQQLLAEAEFPIEGLSFTEEGILFNGLPFNQLSSSEQLKVSLSIAMAMNPELRVIRITDGSLLDSDNLKLVEEMAREKDYQVWIEVTDDSGELGIYIEDGMVKQ